MTRELLNTLYVQTPHAYVRLEGETLKVEADGSRLIQTPLHHLGAIMLFGTAGISPHAMAKCAAEGRNIAFFNQAGRFLCRVTGPMSGNVLLRKAQYDAQGNPTHTCHIARAFVAGKIRNQRYLTSRAARDSRDAVRAERLRKATNALGVLLESLPLQPDTDSVRGIEGQASAVYFNVFGEMITVPESEFSFRVRTRRPPRDRVNAVLSFLYALLRTDCAAACEGVGLDPQFGFLHTLRSGRPSLALDLMEEFRPIVADRVALTLINRRQLRPSHFEERTDGGGSVMLTEEGRKSVLVAFQERKQEEVIHPLLKDKTPLGLLPHLQARLLARCLRGDLPDYLPFTVSGA
jgi:CRISPR-associated protein Cas1